MKNKKQTRENKIIDDAIIHLNGYAVVIKQSTGYNPVAVFETIAGLESIKRKK